MKRLLLSLFLIFSTASIIMFANTPSLQVGDLAPNFKLEGDDNEFYSLSDYENEMVVLFFYPLNYSPNCTAQACSLNKSHDIYKKNKITVFGINYQSPKKHAAFKNDHNIKYILLSDTDKSVATAYGAHTGLLTAMAPSRITVLISKGKIVAILSDIDIEHHDNQILKAFGDRGLLFEQAEKLDTIKS